jgi:hypothetical protein
MSNVTIEKARDEIVFALRKPTFGAPERQLQVEAKESPRRPAPVANRDLEAAIDDMIGRFPTTLEYLAK